MARLRIVHSTDDKAVTSIKRTRTIRQKNLYRNLLIGSVVVNIILGIWLCL